MNVTHTSRQQHRTGAPGPQDERQDRTGAAGLEALAARKTALLTTYKRDGNGVGTPVTVAIEDGHAYFRSYDRAWKTKRLRNFPEVAIAPSTVRGKPRGPELAGTARLLDGAEAERARSALARRAPLLQGLLVPLGHRLAGYRTMHYELELTGAATAS